MLEPNLRSLTVCLSCKNPYKPRYLGGRKINLACPYCKFKKKIEKRYNYIFEGQLLGFIMADAYLLVNGDYYVFLRYNKIVAKFNYAYRSEIKEEGC